jgi:hypothetical protein
MMDKTDQVRSLKYSTQALEQLEVRLPLLGKHLYGTRTAHTFVTKQLRVPMTTKSVTTRGRQFICARLRGSGRWRDKAPYPVVVL